TIAHQAELQQKQLFDQVLPTEMYNNELQHECYVVTDKHLGSATPHHLYLARKDGVPVAAAVESTAPDGYSGAVQLLVAADFSGQVLGVRVLEHHETPGLGDKIDARISDWINSFRNQTVQGDIDPRWFVKKDGGMFDQFTGATITPRAVVNEVRHTAVFLQENRERIESMPRCQITAGESN
ncbi:electron transport complex subunit RsxG, partial [Hafnia alvei]